jgi:hypothetical protein
LGQELFGISRLPAESPGWRILYFVDILADYSQGRFFISELHFDEASSCELA